MRNVSGMKFVIERKQFQMSRLLETEIYGEVKVIPFKSIIRRTKQ